MSLTTAAQQTLAGTTTTVAPSGNSSAADSGYGKEVDQAKAAGITVCLIVSLLFALIFTRHTISAAARASSPTTDFRRFMIFACSIIQSCVSIFLLPTAAWSWASASVLVSYGMILGCQPQMLEMHAETLFKVYAGWFVLLVGVADKINGEGIIYVATEGCSAWFTSAVAGGPQEHICNNGHFMTFSALCAIIVVICSFYVLIGLMSAVFQPADGGEQPYHSVGDDADGGSSAMMSGVGSGSGGADTIPSQPNIYRSAM